MSVGTAKRGRRSLSGAGDSPQLRVRLSADLLDALARRAAREGVTVSQLARGVLTSSVSADRQARREEQVQLELHRAVLGKLLADPVATLRIAGENLERMRPRVRGAQARGWLDEWDRLIAEPGAALVSVLLEDDERSIDLRQVSPFAGVLTETERLAAIERATRAPR